MSYQTFLIFFSGLNELITNCSGLFILIVTCRLFFLFQADFCSSIQISSNQKRQFFCFKEAQGRKPGTDSVYCTLALYFSKSLETKISVCDRFDKPFTDTWRPYRREPYKCCATDQSAFITAYINICRGTQERNCSSDFALNKAAIKNMSRHVEEKPYKCKLSM